MEEKLHQINTLEILAVVSRLKVSANPISSSISDGSDKVHFLTDD